MGFFSDLKEDLSQAVNELMPEEALDAVMADGQEMEKLLDEAQDVPMAEEMADRTESFDISSMLDKLDAMDMPKETVPEENLLVEDDFEEVEEELPEEDLLVEETVEVEESTVLPEEPVAEVYEEEQLPEMEEDDMSVQSEPEAEPEMEPETAADDVVSQPEGEEEENMDMQVNRVAVDETAVVTEGMTITGDIVSQGSMELIGTVNGNLDIYGKLNITGTVQGNSKAAEIYAEGAKIAGEVNSDGSVKIGQSSVVIGNISATSAVIAGAVKGDIDVHGPVILDTTAIVMGNIKSKSVQINNGAVIEGLCSQCYADINPSTFFEEFKKKK